MARLRNDRTQNIAPRGFASFSSRGVGWCFRWKDKVMATEMTAMLTARRRYDRKAVAEELVSMIAGRRPYASRVIYVDMYMSV